MRSYEASTHDLYILIQVYNIEGKSPGIKFMPNPWRLYMSGVLDFRSEGGYKVYGAREA